jgi:hypothetical protein
VADDALAALQGKSMTRAWHDACNIWHDDALAALQGKSMTRAWQEHGKDMARTLLGGIARLEASPPQLWFCGVGFASSAVAG